jgi:hypothetical protein
MLDQIRPHGLASRKSLVLGFATIVDISGPHLGAVGELSQQVKDLRVPVLRDEPLDVVLPAAPARLANDRQRGFAGVRQGEGVLWHRRTIARR